MQVSLFDQLEYTHKLTGERLRIKKDYGIIVSCYTENPYDLFGREYNIVVCLKENLVPLQ